MYTLCGTGAKLYGKRDLGRDGSFIATKWIVITYVPCVPIGSYRVWACENTWTMMGRKRNYRMTKIATDWRQVILGYSFTFLLFFILLVFPIEKFLKAMADALN